MSHFPGNSIFAQIIFASSEYKHALERAHSPEKFPFKVRQAYYFGRSYTKHDAAVDRITEAYGTKLLAEYNRTRLADAAQILKGQLSLLDRELAEQAASEAEAERRMEQYTPYDPETQEDLELDRSLRECMECYGPCHCPERLEDDPDYHE